MIEFKYGKAYSRRQWDGSGTRFRTDGTTVEIEVFFPLAVKDVDAIDLIETMKDKTDILIDSRARIVDLAFGEDEPDEQYLLISGWTASLNTYEREIASTLEFH